MIPLLVTIVLICVPYAPGLQGQTVPLQPASGIQPGLVVEAVAKNSDAEMMGFVPGDVILGWTQAENQGLFESPFDLLEIELQQLPLGAVTLTGRSGTSKRAWHWTESGNHLPSEGGWGLTVRPNLAGPMLSDYQSARAAETSAKPADASARWEAVTQTAQSRQLPGWLAVWFWLQSAQVLAHGQDWSAVDRACQEGLRLLDASNTGRARILRACGNIFHQHGKEERAQSYYQQALKDLQASNPDGLVAAWILAVQSLTFFNRDDIVTAESLVSQALKIQERLAPESLAFSVSLSRMSTFEMYTGELEQSREYILRSLALREKLAPHSILLAVILENLGDNLSALGDLEQAQVYLLRALKLWQEIKPDSNLLAACFIDVANNTYLRGEWAKAEDDLRQALAIQTRLQPRGGGTATSLNTLGQILEDRGQFDEAEKAFKQSLAIMQELEPDSLQVAAFLGNLGALYSERGDWVKAEEALLKSLAIHEKAAPKSAFLVTAYRQLGDLALKRKQTRQAENYYGKAVAMNESIAPHGWEAGELFHSLGRTAWLRGDVPEAERNYLRALEIHEKLGRSSPQYAETLIGLGEVAMSKQQWDVAEHRFEQGLDALEVQDNKLGGAEEVRAAFRAQHEKYYREYIALLVSQKKTEYAVEILERSRARILLEMLLEARVDIRRGADPALVQQERSLRELLAAKKDRRLRLLEESEGEKQVTVFNRQIADLEKQYQEIEEQLRLKSPAYAALTQPQPLTARDMQQLLDPDTLLLEYSLGEERSYVFALTADSLTVHELDKRAEIEDQATHLYQLLTARNRSLGREDAEARQRRVTQSDAEYVKAASALSRILLAPVAAELGHKRLVIVGDGALQYVPFPALPVPQKADAALIVKHEVVELPSISVLAVLRREQESRQQATRHVIVVADPVFEARDIRVRHLSGPKSVPGVIRTAANDNVSPESDSAKLLTRSLADLELSRDGAFHLPRLAFSRQEAAAIMASAPAGTARTALDFDANRKLAISGELAKYRIVHFATHALMDNEHPELSGLVLSLVDEKGRTQNGFLDLQDIYNLDLAANLVVLSACDTALGKQVDGEGTIGLTRGFMYAGASKVIGTLWSVSDKATAELMQKFYQAMEQDHLPVAQALRQAQLAVWKEKHWSSPYFWAAFTLQGDWK